MNLEKVHVLKKKVLKVLKTSFDMNLEKVYVLKINDWLITLHGHSLADPITTANQIARKTFLIGWNFFELLSLWRHFMTFLLFFYRMTVREPSSKNRTCIYFSYILLNNICMSAQSLGCWHGDPQGNGHEDH